MCEVFARLAPEAAEPDGGRTAAARRSSPSSGPRGGDSGQVQPLTPDELAGVDRTRVEPRQIGWMVTLGAFAHCKVDADIAPIEPGDLLTTSPTKGHAQKALDPDQAAGSIVGKALEVMAAESALVVSWDGRDERFAVLRAAGRLSAEYAAAGFIPVGGGPISRALLTGTPTFTSDILADAEVTLSPDRRAQIRREGFKAVAAAPLRSKGRAHGALVVHYWTERSFADEEIAALQWLAEQAALAIDNARVYADATRRAERLRELAQVEQLVSESLVVDDVLRRIAQAAARLLNAPAVQLWTADTSERVLRLQASWVEPGSADFRMRRTLPFGQGVAGRVAETKTAIYVDDVLQDAGALSAEWARETGIQRLLSVPILAGDDLRKVADLMGRTNTRTTEAYRHQVRAALRHAVKAWNQLLDQAGAKRRRDDLLR